MNNPSHSLLRDNSFWTSVEYMASRWLTAHADPDLKAFWLDGLMPASCNRGKSNVRFEGKAWVCKGSEQFCWDFSASLPEVLEQQPSLPFEINRVVLDLKTASVTIEIVCA